ncbi:MAG: hypothetical protein DWQ36_04790 [Acidobacteria bacterium]|nr:MAG: hypothetical protein DWQ30_20650 [Acidobacteriota bacterium]REK10113.1 MAG: hypothetical protein DWQ36_04790 [Acidobacteriota bacterium]
MTGDRERPGAPENGQESAGAESPPRDPWSLGPTVRVLVGVFALFLLWAVWESVQRTDDWVVGVVLLTLGAAVSGLVALLGRVLGPLVWVLKGLARLPLP